MKADSVFHFGDRKAGQQVIVVSVNCKNKTSTRLTVSLDKFNDKARSFVRHYRLDSHGFLFGPEFLVFVLEFFTKKKKTKSLPWI